MESEFEVRTFPWKVENKENPKTPIWSRDTLYEGRTFSTVKCLSFVEI